MPPNASKRRMNEIPTGGKYDMLENEMSGKSGGSANEVMHANIPEGVDEGQARQMAQELGLNIADGRIAAFNMSPNEARKKFDQLFDMFENQGRR